MGQLATSVVGRILTFYQPGSAMWQLLKNPVAVNVLFVANCEQTRQRVIEGSNGVDTSKNVDYLYYIGT